MPKKETVILPLDVYLIVSQRLIGNTHKPCIELRRVTTDADIIKNVLSAAFHNKPIIIAPMFRNRTKSMATLIEKGIIYLNNKDNKYYFNI